MRRYRMMLTMMSDDATAKKLDELQAAAQLELNPKHPIVRGIEVRFSSPPHGTLKKYFAQKKRLLNRSFFSSYSIHVVFHPQRKRVLHSRIEVIVPRSVGRSRHYCTGSSQQPGRG